MRGNVTTNLEGKTAVVTGASKGIGAAIAKELAARGARVVVNYASSRQGADDVVAAITADGGEAIAVRASVADGEIVKRLFAQAMSAYGSFDILVNNAAIYGPTPLGSITPDEFHRHFDTNVLGVIQTIQEAARHFGPAGGSIVNIGSIDSVRAVPGMAVYSATKGALDCLTRRSPPSSGPAGSASTRLPPVVRTPRASRALASSAVRSRPTWSAGRRSGGSVSPQTSHGRSRSSPPTMPPGSPATAW